LLVVSRLCAGACLVAVRQTFVLGDRAAVVVGRYSYGRLAWRSGGSGDGRAELEQRREKLQLELRLIEGELRTDLALRSESQADRPTATIRPHK
jgi:hypothetical protein